MVLKRESPSLQHHIHKFRQRWWQLEARVTTVWIYFSFWISAYSDTTPNVVNGSLKTDTLLHNNLSLQDSCHMMKRLRLLGLANDAIHALETNPKHEVTTNKESRYNSRVKQDKRVPSLSCVFAVHFIEANHQSPRGEDS